MVLSLCDLLSKRTKVTRIKPLAISFGLEE